MDLKDHQYGLKNFFKEIILKILLFVLNQNMLIYYKKKNISNNYNKFAKIKKKK